MANRTGKGKTMRRPGTRLAVAGAVALAMVVSASEPASAQRPPAADPQAAAFDLEEMLYPSQAQYGGGLRARWVTVPSSFLGIFTKENTALSSYHAGIELVRRKHDLDIVLGLSYQDMSPPDGNWLGANKDPEIDTDRVFFDDLSIFSLDVTFVWNKFFNEYVGIRYGAGLGMAIVSGQVDRISAAVGPNNMPPCTADNAGNESVCFPQVPGCGPDGCDKTVLEATRGPKDTANSPNLFKEDDVPGAIPVLHLLVGPMIRIPDVPGLEIRGDLGFFNAFFAGMSINYVM